MNYTEAVNYIEKSEKLGSIMGLERMKKLCDFLGNPQTKFSCIHVAGTNGKGSTAAMIAGILTCAGYKCGMYYSPALCGIKDHYKMGGILIDDEDYAWCVERVAAANEKIIEEDGCSATMFELETAIAFVYFCKTKVDVAVIECGMGGRDDATNVISEKDLCVFSSISLDHSQILGNTISEIASVKSGIINCKSPVVCYDSGDDAVSEIRKACEKTGSELTVVNEEVLSGTCDFPVGERISYKGICARVNLSGQFQRKNAAVAIEAAFALKNKFNITDESIVKGLNTVNWPFRFEKISDEPLIILDGAHNPDAAKQLAETIKQRLEGYDIVYVVGMFKDKDCEGVLKEVLPLGRCAITLSVPNKTRALTGTELQKLASKYVDSYCAGSIEEAKETALKKAQNYTGKSAIVAFGSLSYLALFKNGKSR